MLSTLNRQRLETRGQTVAKARNAGTPTADPKELDADVLISAQALDLGIPVSDIIVATMNPGHLSQFVPVDHWNNIVP